MKKFAIKLFAALLITAIFLPAKVRADNGEAFLLDGTGAATLRSQSMADKEVSSLQFCLLVNSSTAARIEFQFSSAVTAIADTFEYQYHQDTKTLDVYIAGTTSLFTNAAALSLGKVVVLNSYGSVAPATISVIEDSIRYVYGADLIIASVTLPGQVSIGTPTYPSTPGIPITPVTPTPTPTEAAAPTEAPAPTEAATPTPAVTEEPGPKMYTTLKLYLDDGDATGIYPSSRYAVVWDKQGYTVAFSSEDESIATVGKKKGLVTAQGVGTTNITATFTNDAGETVVRTCKVTVKRNAADAGIGSGSAKKLQALTVGDTLLLNTYRALPSGRRVWNGRDVITDGVRFTSSDESVFKAKKTTGKVTAVGPGEATLTVWAVQSEKAIYKNGKLVEYRATTTPRTYTVIVTEENP